MVQLLSTFIVSILLQVKYFFSIGILVIIKTNFDLSFIGLSNDSGRMLQLLLKQPNINVNATMTYKKNTYRQGVSPVGLMTPLHICCDIITKSSSRCAKLLLERRDIDLNAVNEAGQTPLDVAKAGEKVRMKEHEKFNTTHLSPGCNFDLVYLIEEKEFINNFNNLADLFAQ